MQPERVVVVIPARHTDPLPRTLAALAGQDDMATLAEIVVVGDGDTSTVGDTLPIRVIRTERPVTSPVARNIGIRASPERLDRLSGRRLHGCVRIGSSA